jgi:hypothetical protein
MEGEKYKVASKKIPKLLFIAQRRPTIEPIVTQLLETTGDKRVLMKLHYGAD